MNLSINKREKYFITISVIIGIILGWILFHQSPDHDIESTSIQAETETIWICSMHPHIRQNEPGTCPICAMDLVPLEDEVSGESLQLPANAVQMSPAAISLADIHTTVVKRGKPEKTIYLQGKVKADERRIAQLTARFSGRIENLAVNFTGQNVRKGEILGSIYSPDLITAQRELLEAVPYKTTNVSFYQSARTKLKLWDISEEQIDAIEAEGKPQFNFSILSPMSGTVTRRHITVGDYVSEGSPLFEVIDLKRVWVLFDAYEQDLPWIRTGDPIKINIQSLAGKEFEGRVKYIDPFINADTRVASVRVELANEQMRLKPEMFATGTLESSIAAFSDELLIPKSAILWTGKRAIVYVKIPNTQTVAFLPREIVLGPEAGNFYVVKSGINEGEEIAFYGVFKIDAAAQLAGVPSMMNPSESKQFIDHDHEASPTSGSFSTSSPAVQIEGLKQMTFKVAGNCEMCKNRIEKAAASLDGVNSALWSTESKILEITYNPEKVELEKIHETIAVAGHDTELKTAPIDVYNELPACCLYRQPDTN
jgi:Cu(I)/Ag(I) efflux system membrane fusion protein